MLSTERLKPYVDKANQLNVYNAVWQETMKEWTESTQVANYEQGKLTIQVANGAVATRLRYSLAEIKQKLSQCKEFAHLQEIHYKISPAPFLSKS